MKMSHHFIILPILAFTLVACKNGSDRVIVKKPEGAKSREAGEKDPLKKTIEDGGSTESKYQLYYAATQDGWTTNIQDLRYCIEKNACIGIGALSTDESDDVPGFVGNLTEMSLESFRESKAFKISSQSDEDKYWTSENIELHTLVAQAAIVGSEKCDSTYLVIAVAKKVDLKNNSKVVLKLEKGQEKRLNYIRAAVLKPSIKIEASNEMGEKLCELENEANLKAVLEEMTEDEASEANEEGSESAAEVEDAQNENAAESELHGENLFDLEADAL